MYSCSCNLSDISFNDKVNIPEISRPSRYRVPRLRPVQDQGYTSKCVAYSVMEALHNYSLLRGKINHITEDKIYNSRKNKSKNGMSIKEALQYLVNEKVINNFGLIQGMNSIMSSVILNGPTIVCLPVTNDSDQFWDSNRAPLRGYHAVACVGYESGALILKNSWGTDWGDRGFTSLSLKDEKSIIEAWTLLK